MGSDLLQQFEWEVHREQPAWPSYPLPWAELADLDRGGGRREVEIWIEIWRWEVEREWWAVVGWCASVRASLRPKYLNLSRL